MVNLGNVFILGDSYSTFEGYIPEGFGAYYAPVPKTDTDVNKVEQTWWMQVLNNSESKLIRNCSWTGTTICNTGYNENKEVRSFIRRFDALCEQGFFENNKIDTFILFGGTNDSGANSPIGQIKHENWTEEDLYSYYPAICYLGNRIKQYLPGARVVCILNTEIKNEIYMGIDEICQKYGFEKIALKDIDKRSWHPTILGMQQIAAQVLGYLEGQK